MRNLIFVFLLLSITSAQAYDVLNHRYIINNTNEDINVTYDRCSNMYSPIASCETNLKISIPSKTTRNNIGKIELKPGDNSNNFFITRVASSSHSVNFAAYGDLSELANRGYSGSDIRICMVSTDGYQRHIIINEYTNHKISCGLIDLFT